MFAQACSHGIAAKPDTDRQLQEKAGGVTPTGLFSWASYGSEKTESHYQSVCSGYRVRDLQSDHVPGLKDADPNRGDIAIPCPNPADRCPRGERITLVHRLGGREGPFAA